jgi:uncharacterized protein YyaL (SSP411 family)
MANRLAHETSPYLLQHKDNPVDWHPWGDEALERARTEERPILLSIGYSACHWCHVMEHESFEDPQVAALMNEHFVNIKVDREERPDLDSIYMGAVQAMTGHGGWPMTVFLTPEGVPFYGGTYYPPEPRFGMPSFRQVLLGVAEAWNERRDAVQRSAGELRQALEQAAAAHAPRGELGPEVLDRAFQDISARFDPVHGGFAGAPKFPQPMTLEVLLRHWRRTGSAEALRQTEQTLRRMAAGGIYDQLGGGFHRYSVDARWLVPHFEKMLYDNALLARVYLHAFQATGDPAYRRVVEETLAWAEREMLGPEGGFYSTLDADSEGEEGRFYVWSPEETDRHLGDGDGCLFRRFYGVTETGNFEGRSILHVEKPSAEAAVEMGVTEEHLERVLERGRRILHDVRAQRVWPGRDDKVITAWNAMMLHTFAEAARVLENPRYRAVAEANAGFLLRELRPDGALLRTWKDGWAKIGAFLEDHALLVDALLALYAATWDPRWVREARALADTILAEFWDEREGVFYDTARGAERLVVRPRDVFDNATPSGSSAATFALLRLAALTGEERYRRAAARSLEGMSGLLSRHPAAFGHLLSALDFHLAVPREAAFVGTPGEPRTDALLRVASSAYLPNLVVALARPGEEADAAREIPLLEGRTPVEGHPAAYVCERFACQLPVTDPAALAAQLEVGA